MARRSSIVHSLPWSVLDSRMGRSSHGVCDRLFLLKQLGKRRIDLVTTLHGRHIELFTLDTAVARPQTSRRAARSLSHLGVYEVTRLGQELRNQVRRRFGRIRAEGIAVARLCAENIVLRRRIPQANDLMHLRQGGEHFGAA